MRYGCPINKSILKRRQDSREVNTVTKMGVEKTCPKAVPVVCVDLVFFICLSWNLWFLLTVLGFIKCQLINNKQKKNRNN